MIHSTEAMNFNFSNLVEFVRPLQVMDNQPYILSTYRYSFCSSIRPYRSLPGNTIL
jgi:hypothetical protein